MPFLILGMLLPQSSWSQSFFRKNSRASVRLEYNLSQSLRIYKEAIRDYYERGPAAFIERFYYLDQSDKKFLLAQIKGLPEAPKVELQEQGFVVRTPEGAIDIRVLDPEKVLIAVNGREVFIERGSSAEEIFHKISETLSPENAHAQWDWVLEALFPTAHAKMSGAMLAAIVFGVVLLIGALLCAFANVCDFGFGGKKNKDEERRQPHGSGSAPTSFEAPLPPLPSNDATTQTRENLGEVQNPISAEKQRSREAVAQGVGRGNERCKKLGSPVKTPEENTFSGPDAEITALTSGVPNYSDDVPEFNRYVLASLAEMPGIAESNTLDYSINANNSTLSSMITASGEGTGISINPSGSGTASGLHCSGATMLNFANSLNKYLESKGQSLSNESAAALSTIEGADGLNFWGKMNGNAFGMARLFNEVEMGASFTDSYGHWARKGDFLKIIRSDKVGKGESGHLVTFMGYIYGADGKPAKYCYWSANEVGGFAPNQKGAGLRCEEITEHTQLLFTRITNPDNHDKIASTMGEDKIDHRTEGLLNKSTEEVGKELKDAGAFHCDYYYRNGSTNDTERIPSTPGAEPTDQTEPAAAASEPPPPLRTTSTPGGAEGDPLAPERPQLAPTSAGAEPPPPAIRPSDLRTLFESGQPPSPKDIASIVMDQGPTSRDTE